MLPEFVRGTSDFQGVVCYRFKKINVNIWRMRRKAFLSFARAYMHVTLHDVILRRENLIETRWRHKFNIFLPGNRLEISFNRYRSILFCKKKTIFFPLQSNKKQKYIYIYIPILKSSIYSKPDIKQHS